MRNQIRTVTLATVLFAVLPASIGLAQEATAFRARDWRGQPIDYACKASVGDAEGLRQALIRQELFRIGADTKAETGWYYGNRLQTARLKTRQATAAQIVDRIKQRLRADAESVRTAVLIYDVGVRRGQSMLCAWLLTPDGIVGADTVAMVPTARARLGGFAETARGALGVTRVAMTRAPLPRNLPASTPPSPAAEPPPLEARPGALDSIGQLLLPASVRRALIASRTQRLLVLPAADFSTVPFAALPIDGRMLIDMASIVILTGIDELVSPLKRDIWSSRFSDPQSSRLIVGDPDASRDELQWVALPGAREEAKSVASLLESMRGNVLLGEEATPAAVGEALRARDLGFVYFATHGIADAVDPVTRSFLLLSSGRLNVREIAKQRHERSPLVVMSACQSGLGKTFEGGTFGLARGWLAAGAPQIVTSLWDIGDVTTKHLMTDFVERMVKDNARPEDALRAAMLAARDRRNVPAAGWAGFTLLGFASE